MSWISYLLQRYLNLGGINSFSAIITKHIKGLGYFTGCFFKKQNKVFAISICLSEAKDKPNGRHKYNCRLVTVSTRWCTFVLFWYPKKTSLCNYVLWTLFCIIPNLQNFEAIHVPNQIWKRNRNFNYHNSSSSEKEEKRLQTSLFPGRKPDDWGHLLLIVRESTKEFCLEKQIIIQYFHCSQERHLPCSENMISIMRH